MESTPAAHAASQSRRFCDEYANTEAKTTGYLSGPGWCIRTARKSIVRYPHEAAEVVPGLACRLQELLFHRFGEMRSTR